MAGESVNQRLREALQEVRRLLSADAPQCALEVAEAALLALSNPPVAQEQREDAQPVALLQVFGGRLVGAHRRAGLDGLPDGEYPVHLRPPTTPPAQAQAQAQAGRDAEDAARWREWLKGNALTVVVPTPTEKNPASKTTIVYSPSHYSGFAAAMNAAIDAARGERG